ncbi:MAG: S8 family serine peptidase [Cyanobacteria bacterium CAN_BIN43]|nr:S8 family serine peptidase [Cyanobacteria bacterium CAN_BIN43]
MVNHLNQVTAEASTTGRYLVLFREDAVAEGMQMLSDLANVTTSSTEFSPTSGTVLLGTLGVAVIDTDSEQFRTLRLAAEEEGPILAIEPERVVYALEDPYPRMMQVARSRTTLDLAPEYLAGYRDAVNQLADHLLLLNNQGQLITSAIDESLTTWGLQATKVVASRSNGNGIKVAVLDTGFDFDHPDFTGRNIISKSFIFGQEAQDGNGHGTHCIGTACGSRQPSTLPRYGIASQAEIHVGKVLSNEGSGSDGGILQGIEWAIANGCDIISMSLGAPTQPGQPFSRVYEAVAKRALNRGTLIVVAAGNDSNRDIGITNPVSHPANCPSMMAVAALNSQLQVAPFSNGGLNLNGGQIDVAGPGVAVYSSWLLPTQYRTISGTSMATPHVAGIAALHAEASGLRGRPLWNLLVCAARRLPISGEDVGSGLVQAPVEA